MSTEDEISVKITADVGGLVEGMRDAAGETESATEAIGESVEHIGRVAKEASEPVEHLTDKLREFASEQRSEGRLAGFMASQIAQLGISSKSAAGEVTGFISAFAFGGGLGVAIESLKVGIKLFNEIGEEERKDVEATKAWTESMEAFRNTLIATEEAEGKTGAALGLQSRLSALYVEQRKAVEELWLAKTLEEGVIEQTAKADREGGDAFVSMEKKKAAALRVTQAQAAVDVVKGKIETEKENVDPQVSAEKERAANEALDKSEADAANAKAKRQKDAAAAAAAAAQQKRDDQNANQAKYDQESAQEQERLNKEVAAWVSTQHAKTAELAEAAKARLKIAEDNNKAMLAADKKLGEEQAREAHKAAQEVKRAQQEEAAEVRKLANQFTDSMISMADGSKSVAAASKQMAESVIKDLINMATKAIEEEVLKLAGQTAAQAAAQPEQAAINVAKVTSAAAVIGAQTAENSPLLDIPGYGPGLALAEGAAMMGAAEAMFAPAASAAGGYDIPSGTDPITQLHAREMVLPSKYADMIRGMAASPSGGAQGGDIHVHTQDAHGMERTLKNNQGALIKTAARIQSNRRTR